MGTGELNAGGNPEMDIQGGVEILLVASCYRNRDKLRCDGPTSTCRYLPKTVRLTFKTGVIFLPLLKSARSVGSLIESF